MRTLGRQARLGRRTVLAALMVLHAHAAVAEAAGQGDAKPVAKAPRNDDGKPAAKATSGASTATINTAAGKPAAVEPAAAGKPAAVEPAAAGKPAAAEPAAEELAAARQLFIDGMALEKAGDYSAALKKFETVAQVRMTPSVRYHLALCHEQLGPLVDALNGFELAAEEARAAGDKFRDVAENAPPRADALRMRVGRVRVVVKGTLRTSVILIDGKKLSPALVGTAIPLDPGEHVIEARRDGALVEAKKISVEAGGRREVELTVNDPLVTPTPLPTASGTAAPPLPSETPSRIPAYATAAAGAATLIGAGVFWGLREATIATIRETCSGGDLGCDPDIQPTEDLGRAYTTASGVLFGVGLAGLGAGAALWFVLAPPDAAAAGDVEVGVVPTLGGAQLVGRF